MSKTNVREDQCVLVAFGYLEKYPNMGVGTFVALVAALVDNNGGGGSGG